MIGFSATAAADAARFQSRRAFPLRKRKADIEQVRQSI
jgi:hypothetical protein